ncbi:RNA polymerase sigma-70 factor (ECF subfamily) [Dongia mobilis]|uniref:RNA polymerase sigma-70 factor (ECF subfamily) n=1 Tax=Dongia mobilis TaxID=578943 RepID=A0A4V3DFD1_9PROT|nr:RNA polymerase sigma-70 factor (ECF subfamily) [Dongia mobilis]
MADDGAGAMRESTAIIGFNLGPGLADGMKRVGAVLAVTTNSEARGRAPAGSPPAEDDGLLGEIAAGSEAAFAALMQRHLGRVYALALRITGSRSDAEDAAQEVFARVWRKAPDWQPGAARFSTWLYRVTMNLCIDARRRPRVEQLDPDLPLADPGVGADEQLIAREREQQVLAAMAQLPERQRQAMVLCYTAGLSNAAAAEAMEISVKAYEALLVRAKREIRAKLEGTEP